MPFITGSTPIWGVEKGFVKDMFQKPFSSRPVDFVASAVGPNGRLLLKCGFVHGEILSWEQ
jgi:hypothetical protein